ncbi:hypothetical protein AACT_1244 [Arcobacter acticola]|uniref:Uncharacterized protein n=1 Tax=Arcobacter acticola TaxID=1849015 RepID=A0A6M8EAS3_9BACT|nr:hypothetical protein [Arcobacter acticola]QKE28423.1 hypothetical protein AACT_1244 [Arcobacter acticola]
MFSKKEITEKYEITRTTLHNWKTTKPNLYNLLLNSDGTNSEIRELTIILEKYSKTIISDFLIEDIEYILELKLEEYLDKVEKLHTIYIEQTSNDLKQNSEYILNIYQKIQKLNIIERYIFISRIRSVKKQKIKQIELRTAIKHYFKEFLKIN